MKNLTMILLTVLLSACGSGAGTSGNIVSGTYVPMTANTCAGPTVVESATSLAISGDKLTASGSDFTITITGAEAQVDEGVIKQGGTVIGTFAYRADNEELQVNETVIVGAVPGVSGGTTEVCSQTFRWSQAL